MLQVLSTQSGFSAGRSEGVQRIACLLCVPAQAHSPNAAGGLTRSASLNTASRYGSCTQTT
jgi:hypothetical protein